MLARLTSMWKCVVVLAITALVGIIIAWAVLPAIHRHARASAKKKVIGLVCEKNAHDFGEVTLEEVGEEEHTFVLTNTSDHPIKITSQGSTCGCTAVKIPEGTVVPAGGILEVPVKADWRARLGAQSAIVTVSTDDAGTPHVPLEVRAFIKVPAILSPSVINFGLLKPGEEVMRVVKLYPGTDPRPFSLRAVENPSPNICISRLPDAPGHEPKGLLEGSIGEFAVKIKAPRTSGREEARIVFRTDLVNRPEVLLDVQARYEGALVASPKSVLFNTRAPDGEDVAFCDIRIRSTEGDAAFKVETEVIDNDTTKDLFFVKKVEDVTVSDEAAAIVTVGFNCKDSVQLINRAILKVTSGGDTLDMPIIAMAQK